MSLFRDIQNDAIDADIDISVVLRKCKVLSARLGNVTFKTWIDQELNDYIDINMLPDYRIINVNSIGDFSGPRGRLLKNADISLSCIPNEYREDFEKCHFMKPIAVYVSLLLKENQSFKEQWPPNIVAHVGTDIYESMNCLSAWKVIPHPAIVGLVEAVRNRILDFVLEIEAEAPDAGEAPPNTTPIPQERVSQAFNTTIYGNIGNLAEGSTNVTQTSTINIEQGDFDSLKNYLTSLGIPSASISDLSSAIQQDNNEKIIETKTLGEKVTNWIGGLMTQSVQGIIPIIQSVNANLITKAILMYYGIN